ncbi:MAG: 50S ribosomal protein L35 [Patescibacteria group bacterium]|nr:50S ribosomal protein L35 [Patescibacteria group bacterium]
MKPNKSYLKRLRLTRNGKLVARKPGQNHFNAKESSSARTNKRHAAKLVMKTADRARFLAGQ